MAIAGYKGYNPVAFARTAATTLADHIREEELSMLRNFQLGALLEAAGKVSMGHFGEGFDWPVRYRLHQVEGNTGETPRNFARRNLWKTASLEYRGYQATDTMFYREVRANRAQAQVVDVFNGLVSRLEQSLKHAMGTEYYIDGSLAANSQSWHGLESMFANNGTINISDGTERTANAADIVGAADDTYAGLTTGLGDYGGENESGQIWPDGLADSEYDFWTPLIVNYTSSAAVLPNATNTFAGQGDEALRYGIIHAQRNASQDGQMTNIFLARDLYISFLNLLDDKEQINISSEHSLRAMGFRNVVSFDGVEVSWEAGVPAAVGYGLNFNCCELRCMDESMWRSEGPEYDIHTNSYNTVVSTLSNLKFSSPRNFVKYESLA